MRRSEREITDRAELDAVLRKAAVVHLAMTDAGQAYVVPLNFGYADGCLYLHGAHEGRKMDILRRNPHVAFSLLCDEAVIPGKGPAGCNFTSRYRSVIGQGRVEMVEGDDERRKALDIILDHYAPGPFEYAPAALAKTCVFRVVITSMTGKKANV